MRRAVERNKVVAETTYLCCSPEPSGAGGYKAPSFAEFRLFFTNASLLGCLEKAEIIDMFSSALLSSKNYQEDGMTGVAFATQEHVLKPSESLTAPKTT